MQSQLIKEQTRTLEKGTRRRVNWIKVNIQYDDNCGNGHNTFSITGETRDSGGCIHDEIAERFPELAKFIKWHLVSSDGPLHYVANSLYHAQSLLGKKPDLNAARACAVWPDADLSDFTGARLQARLPDLLESFKSAMEELGFTF